MSKQLNIRGTARQAHETWTTQPYPFGTRMHVPDGRVFRMTRASATAISAGRTVQADVPDRLLRDKGIAVRTDTRLNVLTINVELINDARITEGLYSDGTLYVVSGGGAGQVYRIATNEVGDRVNNQLVVHLDTDSITGETSATRVTLFKNRFKDVAIASAPPNTAVIGATPIAVSASNYFWLQTHGAAAVIQEGRLDLYRPIAASKITSGAIKLAVVVIPDSFSGVRHGASSITVVPTIQPADTTAERLAPVSGVGVVPDIPLGYVLDPGNDGAHALVHLSVEGG